MKWSRRHKQQKGIANKTKPLRENKGSTIANFKISTSEPAEAIGKMKQQTCAEYNQEIQEKDKFVKQLHKNQPYEWNPNQAKEIEDKFKIHLKILKNQEEPERILQILSLAAQP